MQILRILMLLGIGMFFSGCSNDGGPNDSVPTGNATYHVVFTATWSVDTHPENFPANPHFSSLVGATHNLTVSFWSTETLATLGIQNVAERGGPGAFQAEIATAIDAATAQYSLLGGHIGTSPGEATLTFSVTGEYPLVTLISMLAPSPDWFVGVSGMSLWGDGDWVDTRTVELFLYDAGTDNGSNYTSSNEPADPHLPIAQIEGFPVLVDGEIRSVGTFTFTRQ